MKKTNVGSTKPREWPKEGTHDVRNSFELK